MNENINFFTHIILTFRDCVHFTFSFSKYHPCAAKHASILSTYFLWWFQTPLEYIQGYVGFLGHLGICFEVTAM